MVIVKSVEVQGVSFDRFRDGATCPRCEQPRTQVTRTMPWEEVDRKKIRIRYHACRRCGHTFKSLEETNV